MRPKRTQETKKQTKTSGLIYHEIFKQKTLVCNLHVCSEDHRYVQTGENVHRVTNPGRLLSSVYVLCYRKSVLDLNVLHSAPELYHALNHNASHA